jgi:hypothetical protein
MPAPAFVEGDAQLVSITIAKSRPAEHLALCTRLFKASL